MKALQLQDLQGVIFDFDGVVVDSEKHWAVIENPYLRKHIVDWSDDDYNLLIGMSLHEVYEFLVRKRGFGLSEKQYFADYEVMAMDLYGNIARPLPEIDQLLESLVSCGLPIAIASSSKRQWIETALRATGLAGYFNTIVSAHDPEVLAGKPAPDVYLRAIQLLELPVDALIAIEDSRSGVMAAKASGLRCIGLRTPDNSAQDLSSADTVLDGIAAVRKLMELHNEVV